MWPLVTRTMPVVSMIAPESSTEMCGSWCSSPSRRQRAQELVPCLQTAENVSHGPARPSNSSKVAFAAATPEGPTSPLCPAPGMASRVKQGGRTTRRRSDAVRPLANEGPAPGNEGRRRCHHRPEDMRGRGGPWKSLVLCKHVDRLLHGSGLRDRNPDSNAGGHTRTRTYPCDAVRAQDRWVCAEMGPWVAFKTVGGNLVWVRVPPPAPPVPAQGRRPLSPLRWAAPGLTATATATRCTASVSLGSVRRSPPRLCRLHPPLRSCLSDSGSFC